MLTQPAPGGAAGGYSLFSGAPPPQPAARLTCYLCKFVFGVPGGSSIASHEIPAIPAATAQALRSRILAARARR